MDTKDATPEGVASSEGLGLPASAPNPRAWAIFAKTGNPRIWSVRPDHAEKMGAELDLPVTPLYDQAAIDAAVAAERERCAKAAEAEDVAPGDDALGVQHCIAASIRRA